MNAVLAALRARFERLNPRERMSLGLAAAALIIGVEFVLVQPLQDKRRSVSQALSASAQGEQDARAAAAEARRSRQEDLERRMQQVNADLASYGIAGPTRDSLSFLLSRTLEGKQARVVSLRTLAAEAMPIDPPADQASADHHAGVSASPIQAVTMAAAAASAVGSAGGTDSAAPERTLYRHRYELKLEGSLTELTPAIDALQNNARPLRVEQLRIVARPGNMLEATLVLVTMGTEQAWLKL